MKAKIFLAVAMVLIPLTTTYAQEVVEIDGLVIIDASAISNTKDKKARTTKAGNLAMAENVITDIASKVSDQKVYYKFEVSKKNNSENFIDSGKAIDWKSAINKCADINNSIGWRLPTKRELMLMWILKAELELVKGFEKFYQEYYYFSATEFNTTQCYVTSFKDGYTIWGGLKESKQGNLFPGHVRCIRDLD